MKLHTVFLLNLIILITIPFSVLSDPLESPIAVSSDTIKNNDSDDRVVHPEADPMVFYDPVDPIFEMQSGIYAGLQVSIGFLISGNREDIPVRFR